MKLAIAIIIAGLVSAIGIYAGMTDGRRTYMKGCTDQYQQLGESPERAEMNCARMYKG